MSSWVPTVIAGGIIAAAQMALQFYFKFVPDVRIQKKHLITLGWWVLEAAAAISIGLGLYQILTIKGEVSRGFVIGLALLSGLFSLFVALALLRKLTADVLRPLVEQIGSIINWQSNTVNGQISVLRALAALAEDHSLSKRTRDEIERQILGVTGPVSGGDDRNHIA